MENKVKMVKKCIEDLKKEENKKEFVKELYEAQNSKFGQNIIYYEFEAHRIRCEALAEGVNLSNIAILAILPQSLDFEEMSEGEYEIFVNNILQDMKNVNDWIIFDENGEKIL